MKNNNFIKFTTIFFLLYIVLNGFGQDMEFSQFLSTSSNLNPAFKSFETFHSIEFNKRNRWTNLGTPFTSTRFGVSLPVITESEKKSFVLNFNSVSFNTPNNAFESAVTNLSLTYAFKISAKSFLSFGLQGGLYKRTLNSDNLLWNSQFDPISGVFVDNSAVNYNLIKDNKYAPDFSAGLMYGQVNKKEYQVLIKKRFGVSIFHLNQPNVSNTNSKFKLPILLKAHGDFLVSLNDKIDLQPNFLVLYNQQYQQFNVGSNVSFNFPNESKLKPQKLFLGVNYRYLDAVYPVFGIESNAYLLALSYDFPTQTYSNLNYTKGSTWEVAIQIKKSSKEKRKERK